MGPRLALVSYRHLQGEDPLATYIYVYTYWDNSNSHKIYYKHLVSDHMAMIIPLNLTVFLSFSLCFYLLLILIRFLNKVWWTPIYIQHVMRSQGIRGPSYKFLHGSTIEITSMQEESFRRPMELTHNLFPRILPHIFSWKNLYGTNNIQYS